MLKYEINKTYEIMGMRNAMDFAAEMFNLCRINQTQEQAEFNRIVKEQGLKAANGVEGRAGREKVTRSGNAGG